jgi:hypothetical protein
MSDNVLYDTPLEFMSDAANSDDCVAQSVVPNADGSYRCACTCQRWEMTTTDMESGLAAARIHTGVISPE